MAHGRRPAAVDVAYALAGPEAVAADANDLFDWAGRGESLLNARRGPDRNGISGVERQEGDGCGDCREGEIASHGIDPHGCNTAPLRSGGGGPAINSTKQA